MKKESLSFRVFEARDGLSPVRLLGSTSKKEEHEFGSAQISTHAGPIFNVAPAGEDGIFLMPFGHAAFKEKSVLAAKDFELVCEKSGQGVIVRFAKRDSK